MKIQLRLILFIFSLFLSNEALFAQAGICNAGGCATGTAWGITQSTTSAVFTNSVAGTYAGEYNTYNVTAGNQYEWSLCAGDGAVSPTGDTQLTLKDNLGNNLCYADDVCALSAKILWTATFTGIVRVQINQYNCATNTNSHTVVWRCAACATQVGENLGNPIVVPNLCNAPYSNTQNNATFGNDYNGQASGDIFYQFTLGSTQTVSISHCGSGFDTYLYLLDNTGAMLTFNDDNGPLCAATTASIQTVLAAGTYYVVSEGYGSNTGNINTQISIPALNAPTITGNTSICAGQSTALTAASTGASAYSWYNASTAGTLLSTGATYTVTPAATTTYYAEATNISGNPSNTSTVIPLPGQSSTFSNNVRGYHFTAPTTFYMTAVHVPTTASTGLQNIAVLRFTAGAPPAFPGTTNSFNVLYLTQNNATPGVITLPTPILINAGDIIGVYGNRNDINSYGPAAPTTTIAGFTTTLLRSGMQFPLSSTVPQQIWSEVAGSISRTEFYYTTTLAAPTTCASPRTAVTVTVNPSPTVSGTAVATSCGAASNGSITATGATGTPPYQYSLNGGAYQASGTFSGLTSGTYTVTVESAGGCTGSTSVVVPAGSSLTTSTSITDATCNAGTNGSINISASGGTLPYQFNINGGAYGASGTFSGLAAGTYNVGVQDAGGCNATLPLTVGQPTAITASTSSTAVLCNGGATGTATVTASGGTGALSYSWNTSPSQSATTATNLTAANYTVYMTDANSCTANTSVNVSQPTPVVAFGNATNVSCNGGANGTITAVGSGGTGTYTYSIDGTTYQIGTTFSGLTAGNYTVYVQDGNACIGTTAVTVLQPAVMTISTTQVDVSCNGGTNGSITTTAGGGNGTYQYSLDGVTYQASPIFSGLAAGSYTVYVQDGNLCTINTAVTINAPSAVVASATNTNVSCNAGTNGSITASATGGTGAYTYSIDGTNYQGATLFSNLIAGTYTVSAKDANGCVGTTSIIITEPTAITASTTVTNVSCNAGTNGSITVTSSGGTGALTYSINNGAYGASPIFSNLAAGTYILSVQDANLCTFTLNATVTEPTALTASASATNASCNGGANGSIIINANGGTAGYLYASDCLNYQAGNIFNGFAQGTYTVCVQDANACTANTSVTVGQPTAVTISTTQTDATCNGGNDGTITANAGGGTPVYQYSIDGVSYAANPIFTGLTAGTYTIYAQDANLCGTNTTVTVAQPTAILPAATATNVSCNGGNNGSITASATGGTGAYTYSLDGISYQAAALFSNLTAGIYAVYVKDANGCIATFSTTITEPTAITASTSVTNVLCNAAATGSITVAASGGTGAFSYNINNGTYQASPTFTGLTAATYVIAVQDANLCTTTLNATITEPTALTASAVSTPANCNGASNGTITITANGGTAGYLYASDCLNYQAGNTFSGFAAATYTVCVQDANACIANTSVTVSQPVAVTISTTQTDVTCNGGNNGSITASAAGGTGTYTYSTDGVSYGASPIFSNLTAGNYTVYAQDANLCVATTVVTITEPTAVVASATVTNVSCNAGTNGSITVSGSGGTGAYTYSIDGTNYQGAALFSNLIAGTYTVYVKDANNCVANAAATVTEPTAITASTTVTNVLCNGGTTGSVVVSASGGTGALSYSLNASPYQVSPTFSGLTANNYVINVQDANLCTIIVNATVTEPTALSASALATNVSCNAGTNGTITITENGGTAGYLYSSDCINYQAGNSFTGLGAGTYTVCVQDANACTANTTVSITQPTALQLSETHTNVACNSGNTASIDLSATGGTGAYTYLWSNTATTQDISGLTSGLYSVDVTDANNCLASLSINISQPSALSLTTSVITPIACFGGTATVSVSAAGGTIPYTGTGNLTFSAGTQNILVTDANGCAANTSISITEPSALTTASTFTPINCNGGTSTVTVTASGGTAPYTGTGNQTTLAGNYSYLVTDANGCTSTTTGTIIEPTKVVVNVNAPAVTCFNGNTLVTISANGGVAPYTGTGNFTVQAGTYNYAVTDGNGCATNVSVTVTQPAALAASIGNVTPANCAGQNGTATVSATGGSGSYIYSWVPGGYTSASPANMPAGNYTAYVKDANDPSCMTSTTVSIGSAGSLAISNALATNVTCNGFCNGSIVLFAVGGSGNYSYNWSNGQTGANITGLCAGNYSVTISDANTPFCQATANYTIIEPAALSLSLVSQANVNCNGANNGTATVVANGGWGTYNYMWSNGQTGATLANAAADFYTVTVMDSLCTANITLNITEPNPIMLSGVVSNAACNAMMNGGVTTTVTGGSGSFAYSWSNGSTLADLIGVGAGSYIVWVSETAAPTCMVQDTFTLVTDFNLVATAQVLSNPGCGMANGTAQVLVTGGSGNYSYLWSDGQATSIASGLAGLTYTVTVYETGYPSCVSNATVTLTEPAAPSNLVVTPSGSVAFCEGDFVQLNASATNANSFIWLWNNQVIASGSSVSALLPGTYQAMAYSSANGSGCSLASSVITLTVTEKAVANISFGSSTDICSSDSILLVASGGSVFQWFKNLQPIAGANASTYYAKTTGLYSVSVANSCNADTSDIKEIIISEGVVADFNMNPEVVYTNQSVQFVDSSLNGYTWSWIFADNTGSIEQNPVHSYDGPGTYPVTLIVHDKYGCVDSIVYALVIEDADVPFVPNVFTPNGDGIGDELTIEYQDVTPTNIQIFDRWGHFVFVSSKKDVKWTGTDVNGKACNEGVYFYVLEGINALGEKVTYKGNITLVK